MTTLVPQPRQMTLVTLLQSVMPDPSHFARLEGIVVCGLTQDSRRVRPGDLFLAVRGARHDAADYIDGAIASGAVAVLTDCRGAERTGLRWLEAVPVISVQRLRQRIGELAAH